MINRTELVKGLVFISTGLAFSLTAYGYGIGTNTNMGAGYFPFWLGLLLTVLGVVALVKARVSEALPAGNIVWQQLALVFAANLVLGLGLGGIPWLGVRPIGLLVAIPVMVFISLLAYNNYSTTGLVLKSCAFSFIVYSLFVLALKLRIPMLPVL